MQDHNSEIKTVSMNKCTNSQPETTTNNVAFLPFQMPSFSPLLNNNNSKGIINFTVNICPTGSISIGNSKTSEDETSHLELFEGIDMKEFFD